MFSRPGYGCWPRPGFYVGNDDELADRNIAKGVLEADFLLNYSRFRGKGVSDYVRLPYRGCYFDFALFSWRKSGRDGGV